MRKSINALMKEWNDMQKESMKKVFSGFEELMIYQKEIMVMLNTIDDYENPEKKIIAEAIIENKIFPMSRKLTSQLNSMILVKRANADILHDELRDSSRSLMGNVLGIAILIVVVVLVAAFYMSNHIIVPTMKTKNHILQMGKEGEIPDISIRHGSNAIGQMIGAVKTLAESLKKTSTFRTRDRLRKFIGRLQAFGRE